MLCTQQYESLYHKSPDAIAFCPYRISPLGAHIDHQFGKINGLAIDKGIHFAYAVKHSGICEVQSVNFSGKRAQFHVNSVPGTKQGDWADHLRGATLMLDEKHRLQYGVAGVLEGSLPIGGLSSSAAVVIVFLSALCHVDDIRLGDWELIMMVKAVENQYVGGNCGKLDQSLEVLCRNNQLLYLDIKDDSYELIPTAACMPKYKIAIFFSGLERSLTNSKYNASVDECKALAYALKAFYGMPYEKYATPVCGMRRLPCLNSMVRSYPKTGRSVPSTSISRTPGLGPVRKCGAGETSPNTGGWCLWLKEFRLEQLRKYASFTFAKGSIADKPLVNSLFEQYKPAVVVNLAAQAGVCYSIINPDAYIASNLIGFYNILEACRHYSVEHLVYASSSSAYGGNTKIPFSTEDKAYNPVSLYAATKKLNELLAHAYSKLYNISSACLCFFTVYGSAGRSDMATLASNKGC